MPMYILQQISDDFDLHWTTAQRVLGVKTFWTKHKLARRALGIKPYPSDHISYFLPSSNNRTSSFHQVATRSAAFSRSLHWRIASVPWCTATTGSGGTANTQGGSGLPEMQEESDGNKEQTRDGLERINFKKKVMFRAVASGNWHTEVVSVSGFLSFGVII